MLTCAPRVPSTKSRLAYSGSPSRPRPIGQLASPSGRRTGPGRARLPTARRTSAPGRGGTNTSGSTRVVVTSAASTGSAGSSPSLMRNTSESKRAPSWRARTWVTTPDSRTGSSRPGTARSHTTTSSSWRYWLLGERDPERRAASRPRCRAPGRPAVPVMRATVPPGCDTNGGSRISRSGSPESEIRTLRLEALDVDAADDVFDRRVPRR